MPSIWSFLVGMSRGCMLRTKGYPTLIWKSVKIVSGIYNSQTSLFDDMDQSGPSFQPVPLLYKMSPMPLCYTRSVIVRQGSEWGILRVIIQKCVFEKIKSMRHKSVIKARTSFRNGSVVEGRWTFEPNTNVLHNYHCGRVVIQFWSGCHYGSVVVVEVNFVSTRLSLWLSRHVMVVKVVGVL